MADFVFNVAKGSAGEFAVDDATKFGILLLKTAASDATLKDQDTVAAILAGGSTEADFTNYTRKTGLTATRTVDDTNDRVDLDLADQTWTAAGGAANNTIVKLIVFYENAAADATRIPVTCHDWAVTTDGSDQTATIAVFYRGS
jgi:NADH dehydrogenase/NADH:ubiquinone oxidoreductase subunit G